MTCIPVRNQWCRGSHLCRDTEDDEDEAAEAEEEEEDEDKAEAAAEDKGQGEGGSGSQQGQPPATGKGKSVVQRAALLLLAGTAVCAVISDPMVEAVSSFSKVWGSAGTVP